MAMLNTELNKLPQRPSVIFDTKNSKYADPIRFAELLGLNIQGIIPRLLIDFCTAQPNSVEALTIMQDICDKEVKLVTRGPGVDNITSFQSGTFITLNAKEEIGELCKIDTNGSAYGWNDINSLVDKEWSTVTPSYFKRHLQPSRKEKSLHAKKLFKL